MAAPDDLAGKSALDAATARIVKLDIDQTSLAATSADAEHERRVAIFDLIEDNTFALDGGPAGPYRVRLSTQDNKLVFDVRREDDEPAKIIALSMSPFRRIVRDYHMICESYYDAIRNSTPQQIESIDMGRRGIHNDGSELLQERLQGKASMDFDTARRLFTLLCALHRPR